MLVGFSVTDTLLYDNVTLISVTPESRCKLTKYCFNSETGYIIVKWLVYISECKYSFYVWTTRNSESVCSCLIVGIDSVVTSSQE